MFPFKVRFHRKANILINPDDINIYLDLARDLLREKGADYFSRERNRLEFENRLIKLVSNLNLMVATDAGFVEIVQLESTTKIIYGVTLTRILVIGLIGTLIVFLGTKDTTFTIMAFCGFVIINWLITFLRHYALSFAIAKEIKDNIISDKE